MNSDHVSTFLEMYYEYIERCRKDRMKLYYLKNREKIREQRKSHYQENKARLKEYSKKMYREKLSTPVTCPYCMSRIKYGYLNRHQKKTKKCLESQEEFLSQLCDLPTDLFNLVLKFK